MVITEKLNKICLIFLGLKGDLLLRMPLIDSIKNKYPDTLISVLVDKNNIDIVENHPDIDKIITLDRSKAKRSSYIKNNLNAVFELRKNKFDAIINFYCGGSSNFLVRAANPKYRIGFSHTSASRFANNVLVKAPHLPEQHWILYLAHLLLPLGIEPASVRKGSSFYVNDTGRKFAESTLVKYKENKCVVFNLGTGVANKCWPVKSYVELSIKLYEKKGIIPIVFTNPGMEYLTDDFIKNVNNRIPVIRIPLTNINNLAAIMEKSYAVITGDTSLMHLAFALKKPTLAIFLETDPVWVSPVEDWYRSSDLRNKASKYKIEPVLNDFLQLTEKCVNN